jgi:hypothetical protein
MWPMVIMLAGSAIQAGGGMFGASQALKQSKYQQDILRYQADYVKAANEIGVEKIKRNVGQVKSSQRAATAASGFQSGDAAELNIDADIQGEIDIALLRQAGGMEQMRLQTAGTMARAEGYGQAAGMYAKTFGSLLNTGMSIGYRAGAFNTTAGTSTSTSLLSSGYGPQR